MKEELEAIVAGKGFLADAAALGMSEFVVEEEGGDPYGTSEGVSYLITLRWRSSTDTWTHRQKGLLSMKLKDLRGCCGVVEINRPNGYGPQPEWNLAMDAMVEAMRMKAYQSYDYGRWGNQLLATTSPESNRRWPAYLRVRGWERFASAINPRTSRRCTIWKHTLTRRKGKYSV
jgi:hypothetical protein